MHLQAERDGSSRRRCAAVATYVKLMLLRALEALTEKNAKRTSCGYVVGIYGAGE